MESERFDLIGELAAGFPSVAIAEQTIEVYARDLSDVPLDVLRRAIKTCRTKAKFFPTIAEIREAAAAMPAITDTPVDCGKCFGTGIYMPEGQGDDGYKLPAQRCDHGNP